MFSTSVFDNLPVFVNTGEHYLKEFTDLISEKPADLSDFDDFF